MRLTSKQKQVLDKMNDGTPLTVQKGLHASLSITKTMYKVGDLKITSATFYSLANKRLIKLDKIVREQEYWVFNTP